MEVIKDSEVLRKIIQKLDSQEISYEKLEHEPVYTSEDAARVRDTNIQDGAKALICFADKVPVLAVIPAHMRLDFKKFKTNVGIKDLRLASREEVTELTNLVAGAIPPLGSVMGLKSYFHEDISKNTKVVFNAGAHTVSIKMKPKDLINIENPVLVDIA